MKQVKAFLLWDSGLKTNPARTASAQEDYHKAGGEIRRWLLDRPRADLGEFERAKAYIEERYLDKQGGIDETKLRGELSYLCHAGSVARLAIVFITSWHDG